MSKKTAAKTMSPTPNAAAIITFAMPVNPAHAPSISPGISKARSPAAIIPIR
jgi:hypothetical protein